MNDARHDILDRIRRAQQPANAPADTASVEQRLHARPRGPQPAFDGSFIDRFARKTEATAGTFARVSSADGTAQAVLDYLQQHALPWSLVSAADSFLDTLPWPGALAREVRAAEPQDVTALSVAYAGVAETGSLALLAQASTPTTLNFLPDNYLCVLRTDRIVARMEDVWDLIRREQPGMPRALNFITGPSRTADVEQTIQLGAHGPRRLHIILLD
jgi:L-lactate dehydrogenase complex protein LldG